MSFVQFDLVVFCVAKSDEKGMYFVFFFSFGEMFYSGSETVVAMEGFIYM